MKGETKEEESFETVINLEVDAYIPSTYIRNEVQKLDMYKRVACIMSEEDVEDLSEELIDRYGDIPPVCDTLLQIALLKTMCHNVYISGLIRTKEEVRLNIYPQAKWKMDLLQSFLEQKKSCLKFVLEQAPYFVYQFPKKKKPMNPKAEADWRIGLLKELLQDFVSLVE